MINIGWEHFPPRGGKSSDEETKSLCDILINIMKKVVEKKKMNQRRHEMKNLKNVLVLIKTKKLGLETATIMIQTNGK